MESIACNLCGSYDARIELIARDWLHGSGDIFHFVRCRQCGLVYINPRPNEEEISQYYRDASYYAYQSEDGSVRDEHARLALRLTAIEGAAGALLDVGCGDGSFLRAMQHNGWHVTGTEVHAGTAQRLRRTGLEVHAGALTQLDLPCGAFDLVTLLEVLEHLHDPFAALRRVGELLSPRGKLFITVPNIDSVEYHLFRGRWVALEPPLHLTLFSPRTLSELLRRAGFQIEHLETTSSVAGLTRSLWLMRRRDGRERNSAQTEYVRRSWRRNAHGVLNAGLSPVGTLFRLAGKGPGVQVLAHRS